MKAVVLSDFIDKNTGDLNKKGTEIECTKKRFNEVNKAGYGELLRKVEESTDENQADEEIVDESPANEE